MFRTLLSLPAVLLHHSPKWFATLTATFVGGAGLFAYYPEFRLQHGQWVADHLMYDLPYELSYWHLLWLLVIWIVGSLAWNEARRRQVASRIVFDSPHTWWTGLGPDADEIVAARLIQVVSIRVKNSPLNMEDGRDVTKAHAHAVFRCSGMRPRPVEFLRWTQAAKPRRDETQPGMKPKFKDEMHYMDILANDSWLQIDFIVSDPGQKCFYGFPGHAQTKGWMIEDCKFQNGEYSIDIEVRGKGLYSAARTTLYLVRLDDGSIFVQSLLIRDGINLGAIIEMENSHVAR